MKWTADLVIAMTLVVGCLILVALRIDSEVKSILTISAGWIFGSQYMEKKIRKGGK